jgi:MFS family permease
MVNALPKPYSGAYVIALSECMLLLLTITIIQFPNVKETHNPVASTTSLITTDSNHSSTGRSIFTIAGKRTFLMAALCGFVSWSAMAIQMSATPLAMTGVGHSFPQIISAVEYHLLGMFAPSLFTGTLCNWFGSRLVMITGLLTELTGTLLFQRGLETSHFNLGLIIVGVGWNFGYVGSSVLLTKAHRPEEKTKTHSLYEAIVMISLSISFFSSAFAEQFLGWMTLTGRVISIYLAVAVFILIVDTAFVFYKTKDIRSEITIND